ncbi:MAG: triphosphoribosyl-dephospho-CoA synthase [Candidatus Bathyarchaeia archaeon]
MRKTIFDKAQHISQCLELAILLEVSAEKPGNVNLAAGFKGTNYMHFLASAVAAAPHFKIAAEKGIAVSNGELSLEKVGIGRVIRECAADVGAWQTGGNTLLGTIILFSPLAAAAGMTPTEKNIFQISSLRKNIKCVVEATTPEDAVALYEAVKFARPSGLGKAPDLDVNDPASINRILEKRVTLYQVFQIASTYDMVCSEWVNDYSVTFDFAYPRLKQHIRQDGDLNKAVIHTFLEVLAAYPDTFIARKAGVGKAREVSVMAGEVLKNGALKTTVGMEKLRQLDALLRQDDNDLNPGTTADIIAAALALAILEGYRP